MGTVRCKYQKGNIRQTIFLGKFFGRHGWQMLLFFFIRRAAKNDDVVAMPTLADQVGLINQDPLA
jgi:hypothetical protein